MNNGMNPAVDEYFREIAEWMTETSLDKTLSGS